MKIKTNQTGTAHLVVILLIVLIAAVGVVGWKVWDSKNNDNVNTYNGSANKPKTSSPTESTPTTNTGYLKIPEMGIKVKLSDKIKDLNYVYQKALGLDQSSALLSTNALKTLDPECAADKNFTGIIIAANSADDKVEFGPRPGEDTYKEVYPEGVSVNGKYYVIYMTNGPCSNDQKAVDEQLSIREEIEKLKIEKL